jgi:hypothetical protein
MQFVNFVLNSMHGLISPIEAWLFIKFSNIDSKHAWLANIISQLSPPLQSEATWAIVGRERIWGLLMAMVPLQEMQHRHPLA